MVWQDYIPEELSDLYEIHDYGHAAAILANEFPVEYNEIVEAHLKFRFTDADVKKHGGNESPIPKKFSKILRPMGWQETSLRLEQTADGVTVSQDTHKIDYVKGPVAFDLEWNSKDQTFDRDLGAMGRFFAFDRISVAVLTTRSNRLDPYFPTLGSVQDKHGVSRPVRAKYGASTTHMGKLLPRLNAKRNGGCPVLVFGITPELRDPPWRP